MLGYWWDDGQKCTDEVLARSEFVTGKAKMQYASRGVVLFADGSVHTFGVRHHRDDHGNLHVVSRESLRQEYEDAARGLKEFESQWITEVLPEYRRDLSVNPLPVREG